MSGTKPPECVIMDTHVDCQCWQRPGRSPSPSLSLCTLRQTPLHYAHPMFILPVMGSSLPLMRAFFIFQELTAWSLHLYSSNIFSASTNWPHRAEQERPSLCSSGAHGDLGGDPEYTINTQVRRVDRPLKETE